MSKIVVRHPGESNFRKLSVPYSAAQGEIERALAQTPCKASLLMRATNGVTLAVPRGVADLLTTEVTVELLPTERLTGSRLVETIWGDRHVLKSMTFPYERVETFRFFETMCVCLLNVHSEVFIEFDIENSAIHDNRIVLLGALFLRGEDRYKLAQQMDK